MTDPHRLANLLEEHAAAADHRLRAIDSGRLAGLIRRRRRFRRTVMTATVPVGVVLALGVIWMVGPRDRPGDPAEPAAPAQLTLGGCGAEVRGSVQAGAPLTLSASLPAAAVDRASELRIAVTVTNTGPPLRAVTAAHPDLTVVRNGVVVATPAGIRDVGVILDLPTGQSHTFDSPVSMVDCARAGGNTAGPLLDAGIYQLYAVLRLDAQSGGNSGVIEVPGGPWTIELR